MDLQAHCSYLLCEVLELRRENILGARGAVGLEIVVYQPFLCCLLGSPLFLSFIHVVIVVVIVLHLIVFSIVFTVSFTFFGTAFFYAVS